jgi:hypothetical protein
VKSKKRKRKSIKERLVCGIEELQVEITETAKRFCEIYKEILGGVIL